MEYKRKQRGLSDITKKKISTALKGRRKSFQHCSNISKGLENYWQQIPQQNKGDTTNTGKWRKCLDTESGHYFLQKNFQTFYTFQTYQLFIYRNNWKTLDFLNYFLYIYKNWKNDGGLIVSSPTNIISNKILKWQTTTRHNVDSAS